MTKPFRQSVQPTFLNMQLARQAGRVLALTFGPHLRADAEHVEWYAPCGCAYHPQPKPCVHPCAEHGDTSIVTGVLKGVIADGEET